MPLKDFHPAVGRWFERALGVPTEIQRLAWPAVRGHRHTLIAAPTGSGKTLAAFLSAIDELIREGLAGPLPDETRVLYVSPLKALSNDIRKNLELPLTGIRDALLEYGVHDVPVRAWVRTGDTPPGERERMRRTPPHILVTTPESLFILLTSESGREMLAPVRTVIVDEIHALAGNKRGAHLALSLERLSALCGRDPVRIGLSATQKPIEDMARFLTGSDRGDCVIIDTGYARERDLALEVPESALEAVMAAEVWAEIYDRLAALVREHRTVLIFVNTRRLAERAARHLAERLGEDRVAAHHGSMAREHRLDAEQRLKQGQLSALVATASLELGIDVGDVDLVCQLGSPRAIAVLLQRIGRSGHAIGGLPKGRLFPLSRDDLVECAALLDAVRRGELDRIHMPRAPLDVLAQQIVAEVASREWQEDALYDSLRRAQPYRDLSRREFEDVVRMLSDGFATRRGRRSAYLHHDEVNRRLRARRGARLVAITNAGAIPDQFDYDVILQPQGIFVGNLNEDFAFESLPGDVFQLGNTCYRMLKIEQGRVLVEDARGQPPNIPFWLGEAPGRTDELSHAVSRLREAAEARLEQGVEALQTWLERDLGLAPAAADQLAAYLAAAKAALGVIPSEHTVVFERFFDEVGDAHLVIHAPFGARINRAWGLALRKRFCRKFNFELQAAATENNIVLSLGPTHSFPLEEVASYLRSETARGILVQALLNAPMFGTRWRWVANTALAVPRHRNGRRVPAPFQRSDAEDLIALVFPDQLACFENIVGDRQVPDHPLVNQTLSDCLNEVMDASGFERVLKDIETGKIRIVARDLAAPSPLACEILTARPHAFLDDAPAEERRTLAIQQRRFLDPDAAADLGRLDPQAIAQVRAEAWPDASTPDELHDGLVLMGFFTSEEMSRGGAAWGSLFEALTREGRATRLMIGDRPRLRDEGGESTGHGLSPVIGIAAERLLELQAIYPHAFMSPAIRAPASREAPSDAESALVAILRSRLEGLGPVTVRALAVQMALPEDAVRSALARLEGEGFAIQGRFTAAANEVEWCDRRLLARIHRYTLKRLRSEIAPVAPAEFMRFLFTWQRIDDPGEGVEALAGILGQLEGFSVPAGAWERHVLPVRMRDYFSDELDFLCGSGRFTWLRLAARKGATERSSQGSKAAPIQTTPIAIVSRRQLAHWRELNPAAAISPEAMSADARALIAAFEHHPASFFEELQEESGLLHTRLESALAELVALGLVTADNFAGLRALLAPEHRRPGFSGARRRRHTQAPGVQDAGRWVRLRAPAGTAARLKEEAIEYAARTLLRRYGVVFRALLAREVNVPPWRDLVHVFRRLEARGEVRGGRFVSGFSGEQYALPEAVTPLRDARREGDRESMISLSGCDPLNLTGIITPGSRVPAQAGNRVLYRGGVPIAISLGGEVHYLEKPAAGTEWEMRRALLR